MVVWEQVQQEKGFIYNNEEHSRIPLTSLVLPYYYICHAFATMYSIQFSQVKYFSVTARQCSSRGGDLLVTVRDDRVEVAGRDVIVLRGTINVGQSFSA